MSKRAHHNKFSPTQKKTQISKHVSEENHMTNTVPSTSLRYWEKRYVWETKKKRVENVQLYGKEIWS
jgi:hypothetical protein